MPQHRINTSVTGNVISGVLAAVIYAVIALITGARGASVVVGALIVGVITFAVAFTITTIIRRSHRGPTP